MKKIILITVVAIIVALGIGGYLVFKKPSPLEPRPPVESIGKCGDNVCDEFENANPNVCPTDCPFEIITVKTEETYPNFFEKISNGIIDYSREYFAFTFPVALIFSLWIGFSVIKNKKSIFWSFFIPIFIYGGLIVHTGWGDDFGLAVFFAFIIACIALFINYCILIIYLLLKPDRRVYMMKKILIIIAIASLIFFIFNVLSLSL